MFFRPEAPLLPRIERGLLDKEIAFQIGAQIVGERAQAAKEVRLRERIQFQAPKTLLAVSGHLGAGKTHVTEAIEKKAPFAAIDKDALSDIFSMSRKDEVHARTKQHAYDIMYALADLYLQGEENVLLDVPFNDPSAFFASPAWVKRMQKMADFRDAQLKIIWCVASPETKLLRMRARSSTRERDRTPDEVLALAERNDIPQIPFDHIVFDTEEFDEERLMDFLNISPIPRINGIQAPVKLSAASG
jgi:predicted kinase